MAPVKRCKEGLHARPTSMSHLRDLINACHKLLVVGNDVRRQFLTHHLQIRGSSQRVLGHVGASGGLAWGGGWAPAVLQLHHAITHCSLGPHTLHQCCTARGRTSSTLVRSSATASSWSCVKSTGSWRSSCSSASNSVGGSK